MLHPSKSQSILQWFNALTTNVDVRLLSQFVDGSLFCDIVTSVYSQAEIETPLPTFTLTDCSVREESSTETSAIDKSALIVAKEDDTDGNASSSAEQMEVVQKDDESLSGKSGVEEDVTNENSHLIEIQKKYDVIEKFIDAFFQFKSSNLINFSDCIQGKDMELAKVAVMLLSAMVQNFLSSDNEALHTITLLEAGVQEDIKECLSLLLERGDKEEPLTKAELHKVLGRATKHKATPRRKTPHRGNPEHVDAPKSTRKRRGETSRVSAIIYEDMQESPLKGLLQSPNNSQHRTAIAMFKKETELSKLRNAVHAEEMKVVDLILEKRNVNEELMKKKEELEHLKLEFRKHRETTEEREGHANMDRANFLAEMEKLHKLIHKQTDEIKSLKTENDKLDNTVSDLEEKLKSKNTPQDPGDRALVADVMRQIQEMQTDNDTKESELQECKKKIETLDEDVKAYKQMYEELLNKRESPMVTPNRVAEVVSNIYNDDALEKLNEKEQEIEKLMKLVLDLKSQLEFQSKNTPQDPGDLNLVADVMEQIHEVQTDNDTKESVLQECKKKIETLKEEVKAYRQMYEELLNRKESPMVTPTRVAEVVSNIDALEKINKKEQEIEKLKKLVLNLKSQLKEKTDNMKAVLDKLSSLQEKYENLLNKTKGCLTCGTGPESEDTEVSSDGNALNSSSQFGKLWETTPRENVPHTRSRTSSGAYTNLVVNPVTFEKLKTLCRNFCKLIIKCKIVDDQETMQQFDSQTRKLATIDDFAKTFDRILLVLKKAITTESFVADMKTLKEAVQDDKPDQELQKLKERFCKMKEKFTSQLEEKEIDLKAANMELQNLKTLQDASVKEISKLKNDITHLNKKYKNLYQVADRFKSEKKQINALLDGLKDEIKNRKNEVKPCATCETVRGQYLESKKDLKQAARREEQLIFFKTENENRVKSYEKQVQNLTQENKQLKLKIQHHSANLLGNTAARNALIRKCFQLGKEEDRKKQEEINKRNALEMEEETHPVVNVNTYVFHPERTNNNNETSISSHFGNRSIKSAYLQTEDEEDFLNHSSLAQIQNSVYHSPPVPENRLLELQRRNTFCPPHLQSSYPVELQDMTPSERKYSMVPRFSEAERGYQGIEEGTSKGMAVKKRKVSETDTTQPISKRMVIGSSGISMKPRTPVRQAFGKSRPFKTPSSVRRLMGLRGKKNKIQ